MPTGLKEPLSALMSNANPFSNCIRDVRANIERGDATEHTHRPALKAFLESSAILHSPSYRERYAEFLKIDFPRLSLAADRDLFFRLAAHGADLVALHLLQSPKLDPFITDFPEKGANEVDRVFFNVGGASSSPDPTREQDMSRRSTGAEADAPATSEPTGRVYINATQYFGGIPQATVSDLPIKNQNPQSQIPVSGPSVSAVTRSARSGSRTATAAPSTTPTSSTTSVSSSP